MIIEILCAIWFGILTSISPCPLATNVAAVSFLTKDIQHSRHVLFSALAYVLGRMVTYAVIGFVIVSSLVHIPVLANFLQKYMNIALGPILLMVGLFLLDIIKLRLPSFSLSQNKQGHLAESGVGGAFLLGVIFALSFCPIAAALFFGSLIPLALNSKIGFSLPCFFGIGTGIPVAIFAAGIVFGVKSFGHWFHNMARIEYVTKMITAWIFVLVGFYYIWKAVAAILLRG